MQRAISCIFSNALALMLNLPSAAHDWRQLHWKLPHRGNFCIQFLSKFSDHFKPGLLSENFHSKVESV